MQSKQFVVSECYLVGSRRRAAKLVDLASVTDEFVSAGPCRY